MLISSAQNPLNKMCMHIRHGTVHSKFSATYCHFLFFNPFPVFHHCLRELHSCSILLKVVLLKSWTKSNHLNAKMFLCVYKLYPLEDDIASSRWLKYSRFKYTKGVYVLPCSTNLPYQCVEEGTVKPVRFSFLLLTFSFFIPFSWTEKATESSGIKDEKNKATFVLR